MRFVSRTCSTPAARATLTSRLVRPNCTAAKSSLSSICFRRVLASSPLSSSTTPRSDRTEVLSAAIVRALSRFDSLSESLRNPCGCPLRMGFSRLRFGTRGAAEGRSESLGSRFDRHPVAGFARLIRKGADEVVCEDVNLESTNGYGLERG